MHCLYFICELERDLSRLPQMESLLVGYDCNAKYLIWMMYNIVVCAYFQQASLLLCYWWRCTSNLPMSSCPSSWCGKCKFNLFCTFWDFIQELTSLTNRRASGLLLSSYYYKKWFKFPATSAWSHSFTTISIPQRCSLVRSEIQLF